ncbi:MAG TPA: glycoside hydrolase family 44 protein, partial [Anaeromyxobacter sp.]|nr:glycoside hydrolase family 44 protein [Anaeromyxobacter sp.]
MRRARAWRACAAALLWLAACTAGTSGNSGQPGSKTTPTVTVTPAASTVSAAQPLAVTVAVNGGAAVPTGSVTLSSGSYASAATALSSGAAQIVVPAGALAVGTDTLTAQYAPDAGGAATYRAASGTGQVTVTATSVLTPTVTVAPSPASITTAQSLQVTVTVAGGTGHPTPTGAVALSSGTYASGASTLASGAAQISVPAGALSVGADTLTAQYTPDAAGAATYGGATGTAQVTVSGAGSGITLRIDVLADRHAISPYVYGGAYPQDAAHVTDSGTTLVRWGGNSTSTYNWQLGTINAANDYYYEDYDAAGFGDGSDSSSTQFITDVRNAGSHPLMTMVMLPWVAKSAETSITQGGTNNYHWSYSVATYGAQCSTDYWN